MNLSRRKFLALLAGTALVPVVAKASTEFEWTEPSYTNPHQAVVVDSVMYWMTRHGLTSTLVYAPAHRTGDLVDMGGVKFRLTVVP